MISGPSRTIIVLTVVEVLSGRNREERSSSGLNEQARPAAAWSVSTRYPVLLIRPRVETQNIQTRWNNALYRVFHLVYFST